MTASTPPHGNASAAHAIVWVILDDQGELKLYEKSPGRLLHALHAPHLTCETLSAHLEKAHHKRQFTCLALVGEKDHREAVRQHLSAPMQKLIEMDIERCFNGESCDSVIDKLDCLLDV